MNESIIVTIVSCLASVIAIYMQNDKTRKVIEYKVETNNENIKECKDRLDHHSNRLRHLEMNGCERGKKLHG